MRKSALRLRLAQSFVDEDLVEGAGGVLKMDGEVSNIPARLARRNSRRLKARSFLCFGDKFW